MTEVARGQAQLSKLASQGNYRAPNAQDTAQVYSRNSARRQIFVSQLAQKDFKENKDAESIAEGPSVFPDECLLDKTHPAAELHGLKPVDWPIDLLKNGN